MPTQKDFKRLVRARMAKTGEAYTAARAQLVRKPGSASVSAAPTPDTQPPAGVVTPAAASRSAKPDYAALAGYSDAAIEKRTGCTWEKWVQALDYAGAADWSHRATAEYVQRIWKVSDWWSQAVTVGYERIKGVRAIGQRLSGAFEATKSKTIAAPAAKVHRAFTDSRLRRKWLDTPVEIRKAAAGKSVRMNWPDGTSVEVWLDAKGASKTATAIAHRKLKDKADVDARKQYWAGRLNELAKQLTTNK
jgi:hypothetical protein